MSGQDVHSCDGNWQEEYYQFIKDNAPPSFDHRDELVGLINPYLYRWPDLEVGVNLVLTCAPDESNKEVTSMEILSLLWDNIQHTTDPRERQLKMEALFEQINDVPSGDCFPGRTTRLVQFLPWLME